MSKNYQARNSFLLLSIILLQDLVYFSVSRISLMFNDPVYNVSPFDLLIIIVFIFGSLGFVALSYVINCMRLALPNIWIGHKFLSSIFILQLALGMISFFMNETAARYTTGALTGVAGVIYGVSMCFNIFCITFLLKNKFLRLPLLRGWILLTVLSTLLHLDGLAVALTLVAYILVMFPRMLTLSYRSIILLIFLACILFFGFITKFNVIPEYLTPAFFLHWVVSRFAIPGEQVFMFLSGGSLIENILTVVDLVYRTLESRVLLIFGDADLISYPRSISEALFYDISSTFGAGSSPGLLLVCFHLVPISILPILFYTILFQSFFKGVTYPISIFTLFLFSIVIKGVHSNFYEVFTLISPTTLYIGFFALSCIVKIKCDVSLRKDF